MFAISIFLVLLLFFGISAHDKDITLYRFSRRGFEEGVRMMMYHYNVAYNDHVVKYHGEWMKKGRPTMFMKSTPFRELPVLAIQSLVNGTEHGVLHEITLNEDVSSMEGKVRMIDDAVAIMKYVVRDFDVRVGPDNLFDTAVCESVSQKLRELRYRIKLSIDSKEYEENVDAIAKFDILMMSIKDLFLGPYLFGESISWCDFFLFDTLEYSLHYLKDNIQLSPELNLFVSRMKSELDGFERARY